MQSTILKLFFLILLSLSIFSCGEEECEESISVHNTFGFEFLNEEGVNILQPLTEEDKNKIKFTQKNGGVVNVKLRPSQNSFSLRITDVGEEPSGKVAKTFYINFSDVFGNIDDDIDTLNFNYELIYQDNECIPVWFESYKVFHNDSLYHDEVKYIPFITFIKK